MSPRLPRRPVQPWRPISMKFPGQSKLSVLLKVLRKFLLYKFHLYFFLVKPDLKQYLFFPPPPTPPVLPAALCFSRKMRKLPNRPPSPSGYGGASRPYIHSLWVCSLADCPL